MPPPTHLLPARPQVGSSQLLVLENLALPIVNRTAARVVFSDQACAAGPSAQAVPDAAWQRLETCFGSDGSSSNWLDSYGAKQEHDVSAAMHGTGQGGPGSGVATMQL